MEFVDDACAAATIERASCSATLRELRTNDVHLSFRAGCAVHVPIGDRYAVADGRGVVSVGGPAPADVPLLNKVGTLPPSWESPSR
jgi:hypothetical protein